MGEGTKSHVSLCTMTYADDITTYNLKSNQLKETQGGRKIMIRFLELLDYY